MTRGVISRVWILGMIANALMTIFIMLVVGSVLYFWAPPPVVFTSLRYDPDAEDLTLGYILPSDQEFWLSVSLIPATESGVTPKTRRVCSMLTEVDLSAEYTAVTLPVGARLAKCMETDHIARVKAWPLYLFDTAGRPVIAAWSYEDWHGESDG